MIYFRPHKFVNFSKARNQVYSKNLVSLISQIFSLKYKFFIDKFGKKK